MKHLVFFQWISIFLETDPSEIEISGNHIQLISWRTNDKLLNISLSPFSIPSVLNTVCAPWEICHTGLKARLTGTVMTTLMWMWIQQLSRNNRARVVSQGAVAGRRKRSLTISGLWTGQRALPKEWNYFGKRRRFNSIMCFYVKPRTPKR